MGILDNAIVFIGLSVIVVLIIIGYAYFKSDNLTEFFNSGKGKGALSGIRMALIVPVTLGIILSLFFSCSVDSKEIRYFENTTVFLGLDRTFRTSPQCVSGGVDDRLTSNIGIRQGVISYGDVNVLTQFTHHSCALNTDSLMYDAIGLHIEWKIR